MFPLLTSKHSKPQVHWVNHNFDSSDNDFSQVIKCLNQQGKKQSKAVCNCKEMSSPFKLGLNHKKDMEYGMDFPPLIT